MDRIRGLNNCADNSAIHKAAVQRSAGGWNDLIDRSSHWPHWRLQGQNVGQWNNSRKNHGTAGNREASTFVNSAVTVLFTMPPASWLPAIPQLAWYHSWKSLKLWMGERSLKTVPAGSRQSGGWVNGTEKQRAVLTAWFTKRRIAYHWQECSPDTVLPFTAEGIFSVPQELYQAKPETTLSVKPIVLLLTGKLWRHRHICFVSNIRLQSYGKR